MARGKRSSAEQIRAKLRQIEVQLATGSSLALACKEAEISEQTYNRWRDKYGLMSTNEAKRLRELESENADLKSIVADLALQNKVLKDVNSKNGEPSLQASRRVVHPA